MANERYFGRACKTCRRRGRGCDRRMPSCNTCETNGLTCEGYLLQWPGLASRGQLVGKSIPVTTKRRRTRRVQQSAIPSPPLPIVPQSPTTQSPQNTDNNNDQNETQENPFEDLVDPMQFFMEIPEIHTPPELLVWSNDASLLNNYDDDLLAPQPNLCTASPPQDHCQELGRAMDYRYVLGPGLDVLSIPDELKFIMQYHISEVVPKLCVDNLSPRNPYRDYILPLAIEVPSLLYACAALAACHYDVRLSTKQFEREFFRFKGKAMKRLQEDLYSQTRASHPGTLATILMLCLCDLSHGGISDFQSHFQGAKKLIELRQERTAGNFVEQYLVWLDVMAAASHSKPTVFSSQEISSLLVESGDRWSFDVIPCPSDQFQIICEIVALYKSQVDADSPSIETSNQVQEIKQRLLQKPAHCDRGQNWLHMTEAYRFAIILYLLRLFSCNIDEFELDWLVSSVLYHARATPPASGWSDQLLWPLFHAGLEVKDARRQEWVRERARCMQSSGGFGNVQSALVLLEDAWRGKRPSKYINLMQGSGNGSVLLI
ncbi:fungal-specific transcription factor domain-containing protein [Penicillium vulpinum]|uniref:Zn(2)-C6 fungal-type domain-containing protein n=1 Tax=Penicillium vulpinum TaxID=29845 RepID=A0A1V6S9R7_9EURO|nr:fungal-specific transcription factor domain-containing protein [Penicillium vulpinum]KAJ5951945.1 fungal-specific transcription factor domain-containing protein [Penicillium vulpinum]OQE10500.1 hypothetical protein PENVUL_c004G01547 [Penicillium vulpinum]